MSLASGSGTRAGARARRGSRRADEGHGEDDGQVRRRDWCDERERQGTEGYFICAQGPGFARVDDLLQPTTQLASIAHLAGDLAGACKTNFCSRGAGRGPNTPPECGAE